MNILAADWGIEVAFFVVSLVICVWASRSAGKEVKEFFLGVLMVDPTYSS
ncbi:MAG: hypothetical protein ABGY95_05250 [Rubritalea sp.]